MRYRRYVQGALPGFAFLGRRVAAFGHGGPVSGRQIRGLSQADCWKRTKPNIPALTFNHDALHPGLEAGSGDVQVEAIPIAVLAGFADSFGLKCDEFSHIPSIPTVFPHIESGLKQ